MKDFLNEEIEPGDILLKTKSKGFLYLLVFMGSCTNSGMLRVFEFHGLRNSVIRLTELYGLQNNHKTLNREGSVMLKSHIHPDNAVKISEDKFKQLIDENSIQFVRENQSEEVKDEILKFSQNIKKKYL